MTLSAAIVLFERLFSLCKVMDCEKREVYTIMVDSSNTSTGTDFSFTAYLPTPLKNVVRVELLSASVEPTSAPVIVYVHIKELVSKFNDRASVVYQQSTAGSSTTTGTARGAGKRVIFSSGSHFPAITEYKEPIRRLEKFSVSLFNEYGSALVTSGTGTYLTFRITCAKDNVCLY